MMVYCDYDIRNENGDVIITSSDHISLEVFHLDGQEDIEIDSQPGAVNKLLRKKNNSGFESNVFLPAGH